MIGGEEGVGGGAEGVRGGAEDVRGEAEGVRGEVEGVRGEAEGVRWPAEKLVSVENIEVDVDRQDDESFVTLWQVENARSACGTLPWVFCLVNGLWLEHR
jgi:hypothetical protein